MRKDIILICERGAWSEEEKSGTTGRWTLEESKAKSRDLSLCFWYNQGYLKNGHLTWL